MHGSASRAHAEGEMLSILAQIVMSAAELILSRWRSLADNTTAVCAIARHRRRLGDEKCGDVQTRLQRLLLSLIERFRSLSLSIPLYYIVLSLSCSPKGFTGNVMNTVINTMFIINMNKSIISLNKEYLSLIIALPMFEAQCMRLAKFWLMCILIINVCNKYLRFLNFVNLIFFISKILFSSKSRFGSKDIYLVKMRHFIYYG